MFRLPYVGESKTVLDSGFHVMDSGFQVLDCGFFVSGSWIPDSNGWWDLDSLSCTPDAKPTFLDYTRFRTALAKISRFRNPNSLA